MYFGYALLVVGFFICAVNSDPVPFITKCKSEDPKCAKESTKTAIPVVALGLPELGVEPLDPMIIKFIDASSPNLKFMVNDATIKGLKDCVPKKVQRNLEKSQLELKLQCSATVDSNYELNGRLLFFPIEGKGKLHVDLRKAEIHVMIDTVRKDGKDRNNHLNIKNWKFTYELKGKSDVMFENLFNGNELLALASKDVIANSGNDIIREIGTPVIKAVIGNIVDRINQLFKAVPYEDLSLD